MAKKKQNWTAEKELRELQLRFARDIVRIPGERAEIINAELDRSSVGPISAFAVGVKMLGELYGALGATKVLAGESQLGWMQISLGIDLICWGSRIELRLSPIPGRMKSYRLDVCLAFGLAFTYGFDSEAKLLAQKLVANSIPDDEQFDRQSDWSPFVPLMMNVAARWLGVEFDESRIKGAECRDVAHGRYWIEKQSCSAYENIWKHWNDPVALGRDLADACDYHIANGLTVREKDSMEFYGGLISAVAMEVLSVLRLRRELSLPVPVVDHPFLKTPLHAPPLPLPRVDDELLAAVKAKVQAIWDDV